MGMSHSSEFTSAMCNVSDDSQICSHSEGAKHEGKVFQQSNFKGSVHLNYRKQNIRRGQVSSWHLTSG